MKTTELRTKNIAELQKLLGEAKLELNDNLRSLAAGELPNPRVVTKTRKQIARIHSIITEVSQVKVEEVKEASKGDA